MARADIPERTKLDVVSALQELATGEAKLFLQDLVETMPQPRRGESDAVRRAAEDAVLRIAD
jgi:hypothetical protein